MHFRMLFGKLTTALSLMFRKGNRMFQKKIIHNFIEFSWSKFKYFFSFKILKKRNCFHDIFKNHQRSKNDLKFKRNHFLREHWIHFLSSSHTLENLEFYSFDSSSIFPVTSRPWSLTYICFSFLFFIIKKKIFVCNFSIYP